MTLVLITVIRKRPTKASGRLSMWKAGSSTAAR